MFNRIRPYTKYDINATETSHLRGADDGGIPVSEGHVVVVDKAPTNCAISDSFLTIVQFFQQPEVAGNYDVFRQENDRPYSLSQGNIH